MSYLCVSVCVGQKAEDLPLSLRLVHVHPQDFTGSVFRTVDFRRVIEVVNILHHHIKDTIYINIYSVIYTVHLFSIDELVILDSVNC